MEIGRASRYGGKRLNGGSEQGNGNLPLFSIVTVVFNGVRDLEPTILSVLNQSVKSFEYIVIDGGSNDGTLNILQQYEASIDFWISELDKGVYDAFNKACRLITGKWVIFLGAGDALYDNEVLARISETVQHVNLETEIVYGKVCVVNDKSTSAEVLNQPWSQMRDRWQGGRPRIPHHQGVFHAKRILSTECPFDIGYRIAADSKVLYNSIRKVMPVFADLVVTRAPLGGLSTEPKYFMANVNEIVRINYEMGFRNYGHQLWFYLKSVSKYAIYKVGGDKLAKLCVDVYRLLTGRKPKWV